MRDYAAELLRLKPDVIAMSRTNFKHSRYAHALAPVADCAQNVGQRKRARN